MKKCFPQIEFAPIKQRGFTLIEIMLVLVLVAVLAAAGMAAYQIQQRNFKVDKTALQMQQWLQAGQAYHADCGVWPDANNPAFSRQVYDILTGKAPIPVTCSNPQYRGTLRAYMPPGSEFGVWANGIPFAGGQTNFYVLRPYCPPGIPSCPSSKLFSVSTGILFSPGMDAIGKMIANRLPNGDSKIYSSNAVVVTGYVNAVGNGGGGSGPGPGNGGFIVDMEMINTGQTAKHIKPPTCPEGMTSALVSAISSIDAGSIQGGRRNGAGVAVNRYAFGQDLNENGFIGKMGGKPLDPDQKITNQFAVLDSLNPEGGRVVPGVLNQVLMISACLPDATVKPPAQNETAASTRY